jgi:hypothetical protein
MSDQGPLAVAGIQDKEPRRPKMEPTPELIATAEMTHSDLMEVSTRLGRVTKISWAAVWATVGVLALGGVIGGIYGLIGFLDQMANPDPDERVIYFGALGLGLIIGVGCIAAACFIRGARAESVKDIKTDFDKKLAGWKLPTPDGDPVEPVASRHA